MIKQLLTFIRDIFRRKNKTSEEEMKYKFSQKSLERIETCEPDLQMVLSKVMEWQLMDFTVLCGVRTLEEQKKLVADGKSRTMNSKHLPNRFGMSEAVDIAPYPIDWNDSKRFFMLSGLVHAAAAELNVKIRWGGDWDSDGDFKDQSFIDLPHFELVGNYGI